MAALELGHALAAQTQTASVLAAGRDLERHAAAARGRDLDRRAERGLRHRHGDVDDEVVAASQAFREEGIADVSIPALMGRLGLTHGGFYAHFPNKDALVAEVKARIDVLGKGGGYVLASCNHMIDVPAENIVAMFETAVSYSGASR